MTQKPSTRRTDSMFLRVALAAVGLTLIASLAAAAPLGTAFTYQGVLKDDMGDPQDGIFDFIFELYDDAVAGSQVGPTVAKTGETVTEGLFIVELDFGAVFDGTDLWLEITVDDGVNPPDVLSPRQHLTAAPYALFAPTVAAGSGSGLDADTLDTLDSLDFATAAALSAHVGDSGNPHTVTLEQITPTTTKGDLLVEDGADVVSLPVGIDGAVLMADSSESTGVKWQPGRLTVNACPDCIDCTSPALVPETGQVTCWDAGSSEIPCAGSGQDGDHLAGVSWPNPRFTDNGDGTVTDELTGLIWLKDASCADLAGTDAFGAGDWTTALSAAAALSSGTCGLTDGSLAGDWRLPQVLELQSLIDYEFFLPALSNAAGTAQWTEGDAFSGVQSAFYWSSASSAASPSNAWLVLLSSGGVFDFGKAFANFVWPVRGGQ